MKRKKLPIGIQNLREIIEENHYYVDKTAFAWQLIDSGKYYFLSRPRRFGKSLFLDTLAEIFACNEKLFHGLYIHDKWDWGKVYPVIRLSFGGGVLEDAQALEEKIAELLDINQKKLKCEMTAKNNRARFAELIRQAENKTGQRVVILVDEYDKPILDNLHNKDIAQIMRDGLRDLYSVIKDCDAHIKFAFLTGVSKFSKVSIFSGLNNIKDISLDARYSALCGYTEADLDNIFAPELENHDVDRSKIREWYNGYNWLGEAVYNPYDLLLFFDTHEFKAYWFETGTPDFLVKFLKEKQASLPQLGQLQMTEAEMMAFDINNISLEALMFQSGYLTIAKREWFFDTYLYQLRYPNKEVLQSLNDVLLTGLCDYENSGQPVLQRKHRLGNILINNDFAAMKDLFTAFFSSIPYQWHIKNNIADYEGYYASVFYAYFVALGLNVTVEDSSSVGRLDMAVKFNKQIYLFEFKVVEMHPNGSALAQIKEKAYADKYRAENQPIHLIGVEFSREQKSVVGFEVDEDITNERLKS